MIVRWGNNCEWNLATQILMCFLHYLVSVYFIICSFTSVLHNDTELAYIIYFQNKQKGASFSLPKA